MFDPSPPAELGAGYPEAGLLVLRSTLCLTRNQGRWCWVGGSIEDPAELSFDNEDGSLLSKCPAVE